MFGHCALSHTVCRFSSRAIFFRLWKVSPIGAFAFSHAGLAAGFLGVRSICTRSAFNWISDEATGGVIPSIVSVRSKTTRNRTTDSANVTNPVLGPLQQPDQQPLTVP